MSIAILCSVVFHRPCTRRPSRQRRGRDPRLPAASAARRTSPPIRPPVIIVLPVCGIENYIEDTLRSAFRLDYPRYELIFCAARPDDPVVPLVRRLMADHPWIDARLLIGDERISDNPKLNNVFKGWRETAYPFVSICDSNVLLPRDYVQSLFARFLPDTGLVCSPPIGCRPEGFWAETECAMLNTYQARWQYFADFLGLGFAQGKTLFWRKSDLESAGGIRASRHGIRRRRRLHQDRARSRLAGAPDAAAGAPAARIAPRHRCVEASAALGTAAARELPGLFRARNIFRLDAPAGCVDRACLARRRHRCLPRSRPFSAVWYGAEWLLTVKAQWHHSSRSLALLPVARPDAAGALCQCLVRPRLRMARQ